jgi:ABC-type Fe3+ transport system substrate-binding protein
MVEAARGEGELRIGVHESAMIVPGLVESAIEAFQKRYGLEDLRIKPDTSGSLGTYTPAAITETRSGLAPTADVIAAHSGQLATLKVAGALAPISDWQQLLPEGSTAPENVSPPVYGGLGFRFSETYMGTIYNKDVIAENDMPSTLKDAGDPRFKDKFATREYPSLIEMSTFVNGKDETLNIARAWGRNQPRIMDTLAGISQVGLGELAFVVNATEGHFTTATRGDPKLQRHFFRDVVPNIWYYHGVRTGAKAPNAATLFAVWSGGPEGQSFWEKAMLVNSYYPQSKGAEVLRRLKSSGATPVGWESSQAALDHLAWLNSDEGKSFVQAVTRAIKEGQ